MSRFSISGMSTSFWIVLTASFSLFLGFILGATLMSNAFIELIK